MDSFKNCPIKPNTKFLHYGFTLAEVLITLGIIGIVAALTIPTLIQKKDERETIVAVKKAYATLSQAHKMAIQENGAPTSWNLIAPQSGEGAENMMNILAPYLKITKNCGVDTGCWPNISYKKLNKTNGAKNYDTDTTFAKAQLNDGSLIAIEISDSTCGIPRSTPALSNICAEVFVDINGFKNPNEYGVDFFTFYATKDRITPFGTKDDTTFTFPYTGYGCTAWILYNENMDYRRCSDLAWDVKTTCN